MYQTFPKSRCYDMSYVIQSINVDLIFGSGSAQPQSGSSTLSIITTIAPEHHLLKTDVILPEGPGDALGDAGVSPLQPTLLQQFALANRQLALPRQPRVHCPVHLEGPIMDSPAIHFGYEIRLDASSSFRDPLNYFLGHNVIKSSNPVEIPPSPTCKPKLCN